MLFYLPNQILVERSKFACISDVEYEKFPRFYSKCKMIGHDLSESKWCKKITLGSILKLVEVVVQPIVQPIVESILELVVESIVEHMVKLVVDLVVDPVVDTLGEPVLDIVT